MIRHRQYPIIDLVSPMNILRSSTKLLYPIYILGDYPLVNSHITMENHHFQWVNPLFQCAIFNSYVKLPEGTIFWGKTSRYFKSQVIPRFQPRTRDATTMRGDLGGLRTPLMFHLTSCHIAFFGKLGDFPQKPGKKRTGTDLTGCSLRNSHGDESIHNYLKII